MTQIIALIQAAVVFGTTIMFGAMGEIVTEKSGNLKDVYKRQLTEIRHLFFSLKR